ncbi:MAG: hypothetical protein KC535_05970 [Nanoarchaeota archaeon]|nr:hypothetical protein [Nanoarchaeota archaeon]
MFSGLKELFGKPKTKLYYIEIDDEQLNEEMTKIIVHLEEEINQFRKQIDETTWEVKDEELMQFYKEMTTIKEDVAKIREDINKIVGMKLENLKYFIIKDDSYLSDKKTDLEDMQKSIDEFLQIIEQRPSHSALKKNLLEELLKQLTIVEQLTKKILADDINLQIIYKKISQI